MRTNDADGRVIGDGHGPGYTIRANNQPEGIMKNDESK